MITEFGVKDWRCLRDVTVPLTPIHAFIGPNDSGKSTLLDALMMVMSIDGERTRAALTVKTDRLDLCASPAHPYLSGFIDGVPQERSQTRPRAVLGTALKMRLDPDELRRPSALLSEAETYLGPRGSRLGGVYDAILNRDRQGWDEIEAGVRAGFPTVKRLALRNVGSNSKVVEVELGDGTDPTATPR